MKNLRKNLDNQKMKRKINYLMWLVLVVFIVIGGVIILSPILPKQPISIIQLYQPGQMVKMKLDKRVCQVISNNSNILLRCPMNNNYQVLSVNEFEME